MSRRNGVAEEPGWDWDAVSREGVSRQWLDLLGTWTLTLWRLVSGTLEGDRMVGTPSCRGRVKRWLVLGMSEFGPPPNARRVISLERLDHNHPWLALLGVTLIEAFDLEPSLVLICGLVDI